MESEYYLNLFKALLIKAQKSTDIEKDKAIPVALAVLQELSKDRRVEEMKADREKQKQEPATARQVAYLKILGAKVENGVTKEEAGRLIQKFLNGR